MFVHSVQNRKNVLNLSAAIPDGEKKLTKIFIFTPCFLIVIFTTKKDGNKNLILYNFLECTEREGLKRREIQKPTRMLKYQQIFLRAREALGDKNYYTATLENKSKNYYKCSKY